MLNETLIISYCTPNYVLSKNYLSSLKDINFKLSNISHFVDNIVPPENENCAFSSFFYTCLKNKLFNLVKKLKENINNLNVKYFISSDCDIWFVKENVTFWNELKNYIDTTTNDIYFMRENNTNDVNCGLFIIKNNENLINVINFFDKIHEIMTSITDPVKDMFLGEQTLINQYKPELNFGFIPMEYVAWSTNIFDINKTLFHHPVCCFNQQEKIEQINNVKSCFQQTNNIVPKNDDSSVPVDLYFSRSVKNKEIKSTHSETDLEIQLSKTNVFKEYDVVVVGCGLSGCVIAERYANVLNKKVVIIDKRDHIGGNCYDFVDEKTNILCSKYGPHFFHTNDEEVWEYIHKFADWERYEHKCVGNIDGKLVPIPVNITTVNMLCDENLQTEEDMDKWLQENQVKFDNITNGEEMSLSLVGKTLYEKIFKTYTYKQWGKYPNELKPEILARIPIRKNFDNRYFTDKYQVLPVKGYTEFFNNIVNNENIKVVLNTDYFDIKEQISKDKIIIYTGPIDRYFSDLGYEKLEYRSIDFVFEIHENMNYYQTHTQVNYPNHDEKFTRITEYKHPYNQQSNHTIITKEYSNSYGEPYYPVLNDKNLELFEKYKEMAVKETVKNNIHFVGRLANYKYFNMDQAIKNSINYFHKYLYKMLGHSLIIAYSTPNYSLSENFLNSLSNINISPSNISHFVDNIVPPENENCAFSKFWYLCKQNKLKHCIDVIKNNINNINYKYFISSDCDVWFIEENIDEWSNLQNYIDTTNNDIYFMREGDSTDVNTGFFIIKNNENLINIISFLDKVYEIMIVTDTKNMILAQQTIINQHKCKINFGYIPNEYMIWGGRIFDINKSLIHHPICCLNENDKKKSISNIKLQITGNSKSLKIVINSHKNYEIALNKLFESMKKHHEFYKYEIIVVIGGFDDIKLNYEISKCDNITYIKSNINSFDYTGLIALLELYSECSDNYYLFLHSTCVVGDNFFSKLNSINLYGVSSIRIFTLFSMNIGIYTQQIINKNKDTLLSLKNTINDPNFLSGFKWTAIMHEDFIFKSDPNTFVLENFSTLPYSTGLVDFYNTGVMRVIEHYPNIDLYKIKANYGQPGTVINN